LASSGCFATGTDIFYFIGKQVALENVFYHNGGTNAVQRFRERSVNLIARRQPAVTGNPPAATLAARCVADFPATPFPNPPATAL
jgi:hypothetical protein